MDIDNILSGASASSDSPKNTTENKTENKADNNNYNVVSASPASAPASPASGVLPSDILQTLQSIVNQFCIDNNIPDIRKAPALQWGAACMLIGQYIKNNGILYDAEKTRARGGSPVYDIEKVSNLIDIWVFMCQSYAKTPLVTDFIYFSGVSKGWFFGDNGHSNNTLTSVRGGIAKKLSDIQAGALASGIVDGRENPTGKIYFSKVLGWSETGGFGSRSDDLQADSGDGLPDLSDFLSGNN